VTKEEHLIVDAELVESRPMVYKFFNPFPIEHFHYCFRLLTFWGFFWARGGGVVLELLGRLPGVGCWSNPAQTTKNNPAPWNYSK